jgi:DNA-binding protein Fis
MLLSELLNSYNKHPEATTVTLLLLAERSQMHRPTLEESAATVLERYFEDWADEQKADLYALLAEQVSASMTMTQMEQAVSRCLWDNQNHWASRHG